MRIKWVDPQDSRVAAAMTFSVLQPCVSSIFIAVVSRRGPGFYFAVGMGSFYFLCFTLVLCITEARTFVRTATSGILWFSLTIVAAIIMIRWMDVWYPINIMVNSLFMLVYCVDVIMWA